MERINVFIEIPLNSKIKYELDKERNVICVDRILQASMIYPANYGFIENTLAKDGDPLDALVLTNYEFIPGCFIICKPIGVIFMEDEKGVDEKIICVPDNKIDKTYENVNDIKDIPQETIKEIIHFFEHYKDLEEGKFVKISGYDGKEKALRIIKEYSK